MRRQMSKQSRVWRKAGDPPWGSGQYQDREVEVGPEGRRRVSKEEKGACGGRKATERTSQEAGTKAQCGKCRDQHGKSVQQKPR